MRFSNVFFLTLLGSVMLSAAGLNIANPGFESPDISLGGCGLNGGTYIYNPAGCGQAWTFQGGSGLTQSPSAFNNPVGPDGSAQAAFLQNTSDFSQTITGLDIGRLYTISFYAIQRTCCDGAFAQTVSVQFDGAALTFNNAASTFVQPVTTDWTQYTTDSFVAQNATALLSFEGNHVGGDSTAFVDQITSTETTPEPGTWGLLASGLGGLVWSRRRKK